jgi:membrane protease YdiL (CAAX protease family)
MIGPILLAITWLLLRLRGERLSAIGIDQGARRLAEFVVGFALLGAAAAAQQLGLSTATGDHFVGNAAATPAGLLKHARFVINSVLYEELVFRGYLLYQAVRWLGPRRAIWLDAAAFGIYHWFSYGAFGNPVVMAYLLVMTGAFGLMWARAFVATRSVAAPIGMHLGWNAFTYIVYSAGPLGAALLVPASGAAQLKATGWPWVLLNIMWPLAVTMTVLWLCRAYERHAGKQQTPVGLIAADAA